MRTSMLFSIVLCTCSTASAAEPFRFPEAKHGKGELKYIGGIPVLSLSGTPEEIGTQMGVLGVKPAENALAVFKRVLKQHKLDFLMPVLVRFGEGQIAKYPEAYRREFEAMVKASGVPREYLVIGNTFSELRHLAGCSALMIGAAQSKTGGPLMGRNWDFPPVEGLAEFSLVAVFRPEGKKPFAVVNFPGFVAAGCQSSAINADGLAIGGNFIGNSADKAPQVDWKATPGAVVARRLMEECATVEEVEKLLRSTPPAERHALMACDRNGGAVFEVTPKTIVLRRDKNGACAGTNHFLSPELRLGGTICPRLAVLSEALKIDKLGVADVARKMDEANQRAWTVHTMVFEPRTLKLHVAFGDGKVSATERPLQEIDLSKLFGVQLPAAPR